MANSNGWGDGAANNNIGWGKGKVNNTIGWGSVYASSNAGRTDIIGASATTPVNSVAPVISGSDYVTTVLTTTNGTWSNTPTSFTYQWYRNTTLIVGATSSSYTLVQADADFEVKCKVTAINASGSGLADSNSIYIYDFNYKEVYTSGFGVAPSLAVSKLQNKLLVDLKTAGVWAKLDSLFVFAGDGDRDFASVDWKLLQQGTNNSTTYSSNQGITANSTTSAYFDTNFNPSIAGTNYTQNNASRYAYVKNFGDVGSYLTIIDGISNTHRNSIRIGSSVEQRINQSVVYLTNPFDYDTTAKMKSIHRTSATSVTLFNDTTSTTEVAVSHAVSNDNQLIFKSHTIYSDGGTIGLYAMGSSMISENTNFVNAVNTYMNAL
jgi:hypothetical protein